MCRYVDCYYELYTSSENRGLVVYVDVVDVTLSCDDETIQLHVYDGDVTGTHGHFELSAIVRPTVWLVSK